jgi:hypothetical protein
MHTSTAILSVVGVAAGIAVSTAALQAQDNAGVQAEATLSFGAQYEDKDWSAYSGLSFALSSSTRTQSIGLSLSTGLEGGGQDGVDFVDPSVLLTYNRIGRNTLLEASARYTQSELGGFTIDEDSSTGEIVATTGTKNDLNLSTGFEFGTASLFGGTVSLGWRDVTYSGGTTLADFQTHRAGVTLRFSVDPQVDLRTTASYEETLSDSPGTDRKTQVVGVGADLSVRENLRFSLDLGYTEIETRPAGGPTVTDTGPTFRFLAEQDLVNGALRFDLSSLVTNTGTRTAAQVTRTLATPMGDDLSCPPGCLAGAIAILPGFSAWSTHAMARMRRSPSALPELSRATSSGRKAYRPGSRWPTNTHSAKAPGSTPGWPTVKPSSSTRRRRHRASWK